MYCLTDPTACGSKKDKKTKHFFPRRKKKYKNIGWTQNQNQKPKPIINNKQPEAKAEAEAEIEPEQPEHQQQQ